MAAVRPAQPHGGIRATLIGYGPATRHRAKITRYYAGPRSETFTGRSGRTEGVAVDPRWIPLGSRVRILDPGFPHGWMRADDTGRLVRGWHLDLRIHRRGRLENRTDRRVRIEVERPGRRHH